jgi:hypothetical protein
MPFEPTFEAKKGQFLISIIYPAVSLIRITNMNSRSNRFIDIQTDLYFDNHSLARVFIEFRGLDISHQRTQAFSNLFCFAVGGKTP